MLKKNNILFGIFLIYATFFTLFASGTINLLIVYLVPILLVILLISNKGASKLLLQKKHLPILTFAAYYVFSSILNTQASRLSSIIYSLELIGCFFLYYNLLSRNIKLSLYKEWLVIIIKIFFFAMVIQQLGIIFGVNDFVSKLSTTNITIEHGLIVRLYSLSTEPSYAAITISVCLFSLLKIKRAEQHCRLTYKDFKSEYFMWLIFLYQLFFYRSVFGILFFIIILFQLINLKKIGNWIFIVSLVSYLIFLKIDFTALNRLQNILLEFDFKNIPGLAQIDLSGAIRVLPLYYYIKDFNLFDFHSYFGFGLDYAQNYLHEIIPSIEEGALIGGLIPLFIYDFGVIGFMLLWRMIMKLAITSLISFETLIMFLVMVNTALNTQLFWFVLIVFSINKMFLVSLKSENEANYRCLVPNLKEVGGNAQLLFPS